MSGSYAIITKVSPALEFFEEGQTILSRLTIRVLREGGTACSLPALFRWDEERDLQGQEMRSTMSKAPS